MMCSKHEASLWLLEVIYYDINHPTDYKVCLGAESGEHIFKKTENAEFSK